MSKINHSLHIFLNSCSSFNPFPLPQWGHQCQHVTISEICYNLNIDRICGLWQYYYTKCFWNHLNKIAFENIYERTFKGTLVFLFASHGEYAGCFINIFIVRFKKNPAYKRHWLSQLMRIGALIPTKKTQTMLWKKRRLSLKIGSSQANIRNMPYTRSLHDTRKRVFFAYACRGECQTWNLSQTLHGYDFRIFFFTRETWKLQQALFSDKTA